MYGTTVRTHGGHKTTISAREHLWAADSPVEDGGTNEGPTPEEMLLGALGACAAITAKMYAGRKGWPLEDVVIMLDMERKPLENAPFAHQITEQIQLIGNLTDEQRVRILEIMGRCPVRRAITNPMAFVEEILNAE
jgi:putative redox protein